MCWTCDHSYIYSYDLDVGRGSDYSEMLGSTFYGINRSLIDPALPSAPVPDGNERELSFGSHHPGGCNVGLSDASVRFVSETIDLTVWRAVGSREGKEVVDQW